MNDFEKQLEETRILHRKSDLANLSHALIDLDEFEKEIVKRIADMRQEINDLAAVEWPKEGLVKILYDRVHDLTRINFDIPAKNRRNW